MTNAVETITAAALRRHVERLTAYGPRHRTNPTAVTVALRYLTECLASYGHQVVVERYGPDAHEVNLLTGVTGGGDLPIVEIGAHWDSVPESPGADDNASGVAGALELARVFAGPAAPRPLRFCFFGGEEDQPVGCTGSRAHVARLDAAGDRVDGAIVLEMIAYRDHRPGTQRFPADAAAAGVDLARFGRATFIAVVGNERAAGYLAAIEAAGRTQTPALPVLPVVLPADHTANGMRSDHYPYWLSGRSGVMVTDTAEFRNAHYHRPTDTVDTLDVDFAEQVTRTLADALRLWEGT